MKKQIDLSQILSKASISYFKMDENFILFHANIYYAINYLKRKSFCLNLRLKTLCNTFENKTWRKKNKMSVIVIWEWNKTLKCINFAAKPLTNSIVHLRLIGSLIFNLCIFCEVIGKTFHPMWMCIPIKLHSMHDKIC